MVVGVGGGLVWRSLWVTADTVGPTADMPAISTSSSAVSIDPFVPLPLTLADRLLKPLTIEIEQHQNLLVGMSVIDLASGEQIDVAGDAPMVAASTSKVLSAALYLSTMEANSGSLDDPLGSSTARAQLWQLLNQSDNDVWQLLLDQFGGLAHEEFARGLGLTSYDFTTNRWSANDSVRFLAKLARGELLNDEDRHWLFQALTNTSDESLIPAALPPGARVVHKVGRFEGAVNENASIGTGDDRYVLVIFTQSDDGTELEGEQAIRSLTTIVNDALSPAKQ